MIGFRVIEIAVANFQILTHGAFNLMQASEIVRYIGSL